MQILLQSRKQDSLVDMIISSQKLSVVYILNIQVLSQYGNKNVLTPVFIAFHELECAREQ